MNTVSAAPYVQAGTESTGTQVLVLGAGLGGLAAALELSRQGRRVTVVEKDAPPWHRVGESFDWEAPVLLERLGLDLDELLRQDMLTVKPGVIIWSNTAHPSNEAWLLPPPSYMRLIRRDATTYHGNRSRLDGLLADRAREAGCRFVQGRVRKVHIQGQRVEKVELEGGEELRAQFYVDASGRTRLITREAGVKFRTQGPKTVSFWRRHRHHYDGQGTRLYLVEMGRRLVWVWNIHVDSETTDIGMVMPADQYKSLAAAISERARGQSSPGGEPAAAGTEEVYWDILEKIDLLSEFADRSRAAGPLQACSFQHYTADRAGGDNWLAVGEAAFVVDPISSGGVTVALRSGKFASAILHDALERDRAVLPERDRRIYQRRLSLQVDFVNTTLQMLYRFRALWHRIGLPVYVRLLVLPQFQINWLSSCFSLRSRCGMAVLKTFKRLVTGSVRGLLFGLRIVYRT